jgi:hypothetical protein
LADPNKATPLGQSLRAKAHDACYVQRNPEACSYWSQAAASAEVARGCPTGDIGGALIDYKRAGAVDLVPPTEVSFVNLSTAPVSSLAITMSRASTPYVPF